MPIGCIYCTLTKGLKGSDIKDLPKTDDEFCKHLEQEHHIPIKRPGETTAQCTERFERENPEAGGPNCKCPSCERKRSLTPGGGQ